MKHMHARARARTHTATHSHTHTHTHTATHTHTPRATNCTFHLVREEMEQLVYMVENKDSTDPDLFQVFSSAFTVIEVSCQLEHSWLEQLVEWIGLCGFRRLNYAGECVTVCVGAYCA